VQISDNKDLRRMCGPEMQRDRANRSLKNATYFVLFVANQTVGISNLRRSIWVGLHQVLRFTEL
jgi:hypothetical protein